MKAARRRPNTWGENRHVTSKGDGHRERRGSVAMAAISDRVKMKVRKYFHFLWSEQIRLLLQSLWHSLRQAKKKKSWERNWALWGSKDSIYSAALWLTITSEPTRRRKWDCGNQHDWLLMTLYSRPCLTLNYMEARLNERKEPLQRTSHSSARMKL